MENKFYREWCQTPQSRSGNMIEAIKVAQLPEIMRDSGFKGLYLFEEKDALVIKESQSSKGFGRFVPHSDVLWMDFDNGVEQLPEIEVKMKETGLFHKIYLSGGKGIHVQVRMSEFIGSHDLPYSQKLFALSLNLGADESLYQHGRIISMEGRIHPKTKKKKELIKVVKGDYLDLKIEKKPEPMFNFAQIEPEGRLELGLSVVSRSLSFPPTPGNRHMTLYSVACDLLSSGLQLETVTDLLQTVNKQWTTGKDPVEVDHAIEGACKTVYGFANTGG